MLPIARRSFLAAVLCPVAALPQSSPPQIQTPAKPGEWQPLFDGKTLQGWKETQFTRHGNALVENGAVILANGGPLCGITYTGSLLPKSNYEVRFEAARRNGGDFFASLTFPVKESFATWVTGGWGGDIVGLSSIDGWDASENETRSYYTFENGKWYAFRLEVTEDRIKAWINDEQVINVSIAGRTIDLRPGEINLSTPFGFASYNSTGAIRKIEYRVLRSPAGDRRK